MARIGCAGCRQTGRCSTCLGRGKRVRVKGVLFKKREVVRCRVCIGTGDCPMCDEVRTASPSNAAVTRLFDVIRTRHGG